MERGDLRVRRQIARINGEVAEAPLKTKNAYRTLPLAKDTVDVLIIRKRKWGAVPWVFPSPTGRPHVPRQCAPHAPPGAETGGTALKSGSMI